MNEYTITLNAKGDSGNAVDISLAEKIESIDFFDSILFDSGINGAVIGIDLLNNCLKVAPYNVVNAIEVFAGEKILVFKKVNGNDKT